MQKWKTKIAGQKDGELHLRGEKFLDLIGKMTFTEAVYFVIKGTRPSKDHAELLDMILVAAVNHGLEAPSAFVPRIVASAGNSVNSALASGVLSIGDHHGGAIEEAMKIFMSGKSAKQIVEEIVKEGKRMPGYGHKIYKDTDPRSEIIGKKIGKSKYWALAEEIQSELLAQTGKKLPLNIDGAMAAVLCELGFDPIQGKAFFAFARFPSMMANIEEEIKNEKPYRRLEEDDIEYLV